MGADYCSIGAMNNKARLIKYHAALNAFDLAAASKMFAEDAVYVSPGLKSSILGRETIMLAIADYFAEYSDQVSVDDEVLELDENRIQSLWTLNATSNKTGAKVQRRGTEIAMFNKDGLITKIEVIDT